MERDKRDDARQGRGGGGRIPGDRIISRQLEVGSHRGLA